MATGGSPRRKGRGQRSVTRPMIGNYDTSDVAILVGLLCFKLIKKYMCCI